jgi:transcriptional regulator with XRE-family HTH domain
MDEFAQSDQSRRFLGVLDQLISKRIVNSDAEFCRIVGYSPQSFSQIRKKKRNITLELLESAEKSFKIDVTYIITGVEFAKSLSLHPDLHLNLHPDLRTDLRPEVNEVSVPYDKDDHITHLEREVERLKAANQALLEAFKAIGAGKGHGASDVGHKSQKSA